jgi:hypothetical protein
MRFALEVGTHEKTRIEVCRNPWWGRMKISANGALVAARSPWNLSTHFSFEFVKRYEFTVGDNEKHKVGIEHERPRLLAGFRRQEYRVYVDGQLVEEHYGF